VAVGAAEAPEAEADAIDALLALRDDAPMRALDPGAVAAMIGAVDAARAAGDSVGGSFEVLAQGAPPGLGSHVHWDRRLDGRLGGALLSIPAVKAVAIGDGIETAGGKGSEAHDAIGYDHTRRAFVRGSNRAGGIEGGMTNGETVRARCYLKPLSTLPRALPSVDLVTKVPFTAAVERTDTIPIVAAGVVGEAMTALVLADEALLKLGGDDVRDVLAALASYRERLREF
jgi:chorismate synthase